MYREHYHDSHYSDKANKKKYTSLVAAAVNDRILQNGSHFHVSNLCNVPYVAKRKKQ